MIRRAIIAVTALALVVAVAVPAFAQDDVNTATSAPVGQTGTISQTAEQCVESGPGDNECLIVDEDDDNGDDNGDDPDIDINQTNAFNDQDAAAFGGRGGDNRQAVVAIGDVDDDNDDPFNDDDEGDNVSAVGQQMQCQNATASNQIENDASVQVDTILSNSNAGDVENTGNVCQNSAAVAQQQNDDED